MNLIELTNEPIDTARLLQTISHPDAGGEVLFVGTTRRKTVEKNSDKDSDKDSDKKGGVETITDYLVYEAYQPMALRQMERLVEQARQQWPILGVAIVHRLGKVLPEEASIAIAVSTPHRAEAFEAARWLIDTIKQDVPIWKQENFHNATSQWVHPNTQPADQQLTKHTASGEACQDVAEERS